MRSPATRVPPHLPLAVLALLTARPAPAGEPDGPNADGRPNLIVLMTDDQRSDALGCTGSPVLCTPHIDGLAARGVLFENAFTTTAICMTSRACVLTGQHAARHGVRDFATGLTPEQIRNTYLGRLHAAGYRTGFVGKWGVGDPRTADPVLDFNRGFPGQGRYFPDAPKRGVKAGRHLTATMGDDAVEFLDGCEPGVPFHLSVSFKAPHVQDSRNITDDVFPSDPALSPLYDDVTFPPPPTAAPAHHDRLPDFLKNSLLRDRWAVRFRSPARYQQCVRDYHRLIAGVDAVVGRVRAALEERGLAGNTVIVFTSDHGFFLGEYGLAGKWTPHEASIRVPLILFDPRAGLARTRRRTEPALLIDVAPTLLDYAGVDVPDVMQGESLRPLADGEDPDRWRTEWFYEHHFEAGGRIPPSEGGRSERWKYARYLMPGDLEEGTARWEELYDLSVDPHETTNLAADPAHAATLADRRAAWARWRERVK